MKNPFSRKGPEHRTANPGLFRRRPKAERSHHEHGHVPPANQPRRSVSDAIKAALGADAYTKANSPATTMAMLLTAKPTYEGTVPAAIKARRRAKNKAARIARRAHRR